MECQIGVISGDGIGPEIVTEAKKVLDCVGKKYGHSFHYTEILMGGCSIDATGVPLTDEAIAAFCIGIRQFLLLPNSTITVSSTISMIVP